MRSITVGTRRSTLAKTQTAQVVKALLARRPDLQVQTLEIVTKGDRIVDVPLSEVGGKGLFISEIEEALLRGEIDFAVHSMKDVPALLAPGLTIAAVPPREDPRDLLISRQGCTLATLPRGAAVGTSSLRRAAQLLHARPDLQIRALRGNIDSRLRKLVGLDAIVLAAAGLLRMGWWDEDGWRQGGNRVAGNGWRQDGDRDAGNGWRQDDGAVLTALPLALADMLPAVGQGALALEARAHDEELIAVLRTLHDSDSAWQIEAERAFLATVGGSCQAPIAAYGGGSEVGAAMGGRGGRGRGRGGTATGGGAAMGGRVGHGGAVRESEHDGRLSLSGLIGSPDGRRIVRAAVRGPDAAAIGRELAEQLLEQGGRDILEGLRTGQMG